ncbi:MAG: protein-L-isoaspartate(D-aspartate) O-methyltransferase [Candidatus Omnitrophica bacterium]|nr:protein-L-isoaspartate(D-aspartate) O-methyltransferase [Candidatus Omnitrophota bacterium]
MDFDMMRRRMVEEQLIARGIADRKVLEAFMKVPRHEFVREEFFESAYGDHPLPIGNNQTISQPYMVALMTECLGLKGDERVLEIGTGSGYQMAILCQIAKEIYSVERFKDLAENADSVLKRLGYANYAIKVGDGTLGWEDRAPYDAVIVTAGAPGIPRSLVGQMKDGGRLVIPMGGEFGQVLTVVRKKGDTVEASEVCGCMFVPLIGREGWQKK